jgi:hydrogenase nickel incorporation protein HypB
MATSNVRVYRDLMGENEKWAAQTREFLGAKKLTMLNLIGSPGSGKTTLLECLVQEAGDRVRFSVLEGDVETTHDAERIARLDIPVSQLLTNGACHLEAKLVHYALKDLATSEGSVVVVENVGNLVCPAEFDIGEHAKIAVLSVTEGEDKPLKYPLLFRECKAVVLSKTDLLPHLRFDIAQCRDYVRQVNASVPVFEVSAMSGAGVRELLNWVLSVRA